ncbi:MAG: hypothetical protein OXB93_03405 [Cytophagales bacterium]|nr:hypothetical protein [Cytophagales bacterium]
MKNINPSWIIPILEASQLFWEDLQQSIGLAFHQLGEWKSLWKKLSYLNASSGPPASLGGWNDPPPFQPSLGEKKQDPTPPFVHSSVPKLRSFPKAFQFPKTQDNLVQRSSQRISTQAYRPTRGSTPSLGGKTLVGPTRGSIPFPIQKKGQLPEVIYNSWPSEKKINKDPMVKNQIMPPPFLSTGSTLLTSFHRPPLPLKGSSFHAVSDSSSSEEDFYISDGMGKFESNGLVQKEPRISSRSRPRSLEILGPSSSRSFPRPGSSPEPRKGGIGRKGVKSGVSSPLSVPLSTPPNSLESSHLGSLSEPRETHHWSLSVHIDRGIHIENLKSHESEKLEEIQEQWMERLLYILEDSVGELKNLTNTISHT